MARLIALGIVGLTLAACGESSTTVTQLGPPGITKGAASSQLSSQFATATLPAGVTPGPLAQCIVDKLFDSGKFSDSEVQQILKANSPGELPKALQDRYTSVVQTPCLSP